MMKILGIFDILCFFISNHGVKSDTDSRTRNSIGAMDYKFSETDNRLLCWWHSRW